MSKVFQFKTVQIIPAAIEEVWAFFSAPENLKTITPSHLGFQILSDKYGDTMYAGELIEYTVKPLLGIPLYWMTEITQVVPLQYFIDEQRCGPYSFWHHQHHFKKVPEGVEMTDIVHYKIPYWILGDVANYLFVKSQLKRIFDFRKKVTDKKFTTLKDG